MSQFFPEKVPWVMTTPTQRLPTTRPPSTPLGADLPLPAPPVLEPPPRQQLESVECELTQEEADMMKNLRAISKAGMSLTDEMNQQLQILEDKEKQQKQNSILTHGHLNKWKRMREKVNAAADRIKKLDSEWDQLVQQVMSKFQYHLLTYQTARQDLMEAYNLKLQEMHSMKSELSQASTAMLQETVKKEEFTAPDCAEQMQKLQQAISDSTQVFDLTGDDEEMDTQVIADSPSEKDLKDKQVKANTFRASVSPNRVANQTLKPKKNQ